MFSAYMTQLYGTDIRIGYSESMDEFSVACSEKNMKITEELFASKATRGLALCTWLLPHV